MICTQPVDSKVAAVAEAAVAEAAAHDRRRVRNPDLNPDLNPASSTSAIAPQHTEPGESRGWQSSEYSPRQQTIDQPTFGQSTNGEPTINSTNTEPAVTESTVDEPPFNISSERQSAE